MWNFVWHPVATGEALGDALYGTVSTLSTRGLSGWADDALTRAIVAGPAAVGEGLGELVSSAATGSRILSAAGTLVETAGSLARAAGGGGGRLALGLSEHLDTFAASQGATTWKSFLDPLHWKPTMVEKLADPNTKILFNLEGVEVWPGVSRAARGAGGATDWELLQIQQNPQWWTTIEWWKGGTQVPNPFQ